MRAIEMITDRVGLPAVQEIEIKHTDLTGDALIEQVTELAGRLGLDAKQLLGGNVEVPKLIEATAEPEPAEVVEQDSATFPEWCGLSRKSGANNG
jgi:hypothetical protein